MRIKSKKHVTKLKVNHVAIPRSLIHLHLHYRHNWLWATYLLYVHKPKTKLLRISVVSYISLNYIKLIMWFFCVCYCKNWPKITFLVTFIIEKSLLTFKKLFIVTFYPPQNYFSTNLVAARSTFGISVLLRKISTLQKKIPTIITGISRKLLGFNYM